MYFCMYLYVFLYVCCLCVYAYMRICVVGKEGDVDGTKDTMFQLVRNT